MNRDDPIAKKQLEMERKALEKQRRELERDRALLEAEKRGEDVPVLQDLSEEAGQFVLLEPAGQDATSEPASRARRSTEPGTVKCIACAERIKEAARKCRHCGHVIGQRLDGKPVRSRCSNCGGKKLLRQNRISAAGWAVLLLGVLLMCVVAGVAFVFLKNGMRDVGLLLGAVLGFVLIYVGNELRDLGLRCATCGYSQ